MHRRLRVPTWSMADDATTAPLSFVMSESGQTTTTCTITDLPNEVLVLILSYLDAHTILHLRSVCQRFQAVARDPIHWSTVSWKASNRVRDADCLKFALKLSKGVLKHLSLSCVYGFRMSKFIDQIMTCHSLQSISLEQVKYTKAQVIKLLHLPALTYLHLDQVVLSIFFTVVRSNVCNSQLKTLSFSVSNDIVVPMHYITAWSKYNYMPPDLRISVLSLQQVEKILSLPPSTSHNACLSVYRLTSEKFVPRHPLTQFSFNPSVSLSLVRSVWPDEILSSENFITGKFPADVCYNLSELHLEDNDLVGSSTLETLAGLCPNLKHLNIKHCKSVLSKLEGLDAIVSGCPKLRILNLSHLRSVECVDRLWVLLASMSNLRVLYIDADLLRDPDPILKLTTIYVNGVYEIYGINIYTLHANALLKFAADIPSLEIFRCELYSTTYGSVSLFSNLSPNLTHLYLTGDRLTLPTNPLCYTHLQQMYLECDDFVFHEDLADALVQSKNLSVLSLKIHSIVVKEIVKLASLLEPLCILHIHSSNYPPGFRKTKHTTTEHGKAAAFSRSLVRRAKREGRIIDIIIHDLRCYSWTCCNTLVSLIGLLE